MENIKKFLGNKTIAYYLVAVNVILALVGAILFFSTYGPAMPTTATSLVPQTIGIFLLAGFVIELVVLALPQYRFIHIGAVAMFALAFYKEVLIIPSLIADEINNVHYQGGDLKLNIAYMVLIVLPIIIGIVISFVGLYKNEADATKDMSLKGVKNIAVAAVGGVIVVASITSSSAVSVYMKKHAPVPVPEVVEIYDPITDEIKEAANKVDYTFNPDSVIIKQQKEYSYSNSELSGLSDSATRTGHNLVYYFEGSYAEGYQGDYGETYAHIYLWDDGLYVGKSKDTSIKGYWYNSSLESTGTKEVVNEETGETSIVDVADCLNMVSNISKYESIITEPADGFYEKQAYIYLNMGWGQRSIIVNGFKWYPEVALFIDANTEGKPVEVHTGDEFTIDAWTGNRVLKNLSYSSVFKRSDVKWSIPQDAVKDGEVIATADFEVTATYNGFTAKQLVKVLPPETTEA